MIAVLVAMREELAGIVDDNALVEASKSAFPNGIEHPFAYVKDDERSTVFVLTGIGKSNAAAAAQWSIDMFEPDAVINFGTAGAIDPQVEPGSLVIATGCITADFDTTAFGHPKGEVTDSGLVMECDEAMRLEAREAVLQMNVASFSGIMATTDSFIDDEARARSIAEEFGAIACDMESAAIAQTCGRNRIPFSSIKKISDSADADAGEAFESLEQEGRDIASVARAVVEKMLAARRNA